MSKPTDPIISPKTLLKVLSVAGSDTVLVGGQSLAYWVKYYDIPTPDNLDVITRDADFSVSSRAHEAPLKRFAKAINGQYHISQGAMSQLVGVALADQNGQTINIDVLWKVNGFTPGEAESRALKVSDEQNNHFQVMHPLDVLWSRMINLHTILEKQNEQGIEQAKLSCQVARCFIKSEVLKIQSMGLSQKECARKISNALNPIRQMMKTDACKKNEKRFDVYVADALPVDCIGQESDFWTQEWPHIKERMSKEYTPKALFKKK